MDFLLYSAYCFNKCLTNVTELLIWESSYRILKFWPIPCSSWKENVCQCQRFTRSKKHNKVVKISTSTANSVLSIGFPQENPSCELTRHSGLPRGRCRVSSQDIAPSDSRFPMGLTVVLQDLHCLAETWNLLGYNQLAYLLEFDISLHQKEFLNWQN